MYILLNAEGAKELIFKETSALRAKPVLACVFGARQQRRVLLAPAVNMIEPRTVL
jgi:hypothetical protein